MRDVGSTSPIRRRWSCGPALEPSRPTRQQLGAAGEFPPRPTGFGARPLGRVDAQPGGVIDAADAALGEVGGERRAARPSRRADLGDEALCDGVRFWAVGRDGAGGAALGPADDVEAWRDAALLVCEDAVLGGKRTA